MTEYVCLTSPFYPQDLSSKFSHLHTSVSLFHFLANSFPAASKRPIFLLFTVLPAKLGLKISKLSCFKFPA